MTDRGFAGQRRAKCRSCQAPIIWVTTQQDKQIPLDPEPTHVGNVVRALDGRARVTDAELPGVPRYRAHFVTCPNAKEHRR